MNRVILTASKELANDAQTNKCHLTGQYHAQLFMRAAGCWSLAVVTACLTCLPADTTLAADGHMGILTGNPGKHMDGDKVLAEVPYGTRLWVFSKKPGWAEVKLPGKEEHGWLSDKSIEVEKTTEHQHSQLIEAHELSMKANGQHKANQLRETRRSYEESLQLKRAALGHRHPDHLETLNTLLRTYPKTPDRLRAT